MQWTYLIGAVGLTALFYWLGWWLVNLFREEGTPKKSFSSLWKKALTEEQLTGLERYLLIERLVAVVILFFFSVIIFYKGWTTNSPLDLDTSSWIPFPALLLLSFICCVPLLYWGNYVLLIISFFAGSSGWDIELHWLKWLRRFSNKREEKRGCWGSVVTFAQFLVLCIEFLFSFAFCFVVLKMAFTN